MTLRAEGTFEVGDYAPVELGEAPIRTALEPSVMTMEKVYSGEVSGRSATIFTSAYDTATGRGTYLALESFEGSLHKVTGTFNFLHLASTTGSDRSNEFFLIVPDSGTAALTGITGAGRLTIDADGIHRVRFDYSLDRLE